MCLLLQTSSVYAFIWDFRIDQSIQSKTKTSGPRSSVMARVALMQDVGAFPPPLQTKHQQLPDWQLSRAGGCGWVFLLLSFDSTHAGTLASVRDRGRWPPDTLRLVAFLINALLCRWETASATHKERKYHSNDNVKPLEKKTQEGGSRLNIWKTMKT